MQPDDRYRAGLDRTAAFILAWSGFVRDVAHMSYADDEDCWSFGLAPHVTTACPLTLVIGRTSQCFSLALAEENLTDIPVETFDLFLPLLQAVANGQVVARQRIARATGLPYSIEMRVGPEPIPLFSRQRIFNRDAAVGPDDTQIHDRHFLPYRRDGAFRK